MFKLVSLDCGIQLFFMICLVFTSMRDHGTYTHITCSLMVYPSLMHIIHTQTSGIHTYNHDQENYLCYADLHLIYVHALLHNP